MPTKGDNNDDKDRHGRLFSQFCVHKTKPDSLAVWLDKQSCANFVCLHQLDCHLTIDMMAS